MATAVIDSNVLIAVASRRDQDHETGARIVSGIDRNELPTVRVTNYVVAETLNYVHERQHHDVAVELYDRLERGSGFELVHLAKRDFTRGIDLFETYAGLSFVDATIVAYMERAELDHLYSFDSDFDGIEDVIRLETADDPFA